VAVRGHRIAVAWIESHRKGDAAMTVVRTGRWQ
jgi:hypothetical protein